MGEAMQVTKSWSCWGTTSSAHFHAIKDQNLIVATSLSLAPLQRSIEHLLELTRPYSWLAAATTPHDQPKCVITGAGRGIGEAIAAAMSKEGASLALVARTQKQLDEVAETCRTHGAADVEVYPTDLTDHAAVDDLAKKLLDKHKVISILVNNAGAILGEGGPLTGDPDAWAKMMDLNLNTPMRLTARFAPAMVEQKQGLIINMGSVAAVEPMTKGCAYAATKHGLRGWSLSCYQNLREHNIKVVLINPGMVATQMTQGMGGNEERKIQPNDIADAAMLAVRSSNSACPQEITIRPVLPVAG